MKALVSTNESVIFAYSTTVDGEDEPIYNAHTIPNAARIVEVAENEFDVHPDLFWVDCNNSVVADSYYYDKSDNTIKAKDDYTIPA